MQKHVMEPELRHLASFPEINSDIIIECNLDYRISYLNPAGIKKFPELRDYLPNCRQHPLFQGIDAFISTAKNNLKSDSLETTVDSVIIENADYERTLKFIPDIGKIRIYAHDITHLKQVEQELKIARNLAEQANKQKRPKEFKISLANISHEIKTPLHAIIGFTDLLLGDETDVSRRESLRTVNQAGHNLLNIINDMLDYSSIERDALEIYSQTFGIRDLLENLRIRFNSQASAKDLAFQVLIDDNFPVNVIGDKHRICQILINLLSNAVKFTHHGKITLLCEYDRQTAVIKVSDTGIGIAPNKQDLIFQPFHQADLSSTREFGGTGLGLPITKHLATMMGGTITLQSDVECGATFICELPLPTAAPDALIHHKMTQTGKSAMGEKMVRGWLNTSEHTEYIYSYLPKLPDAIERLKNAIRRNQPQKIEFLSHEIKGVSGNLGMTELYESVARINLEITRNKYNIEKIKKQFINLQKIITSIPDAYFDKTHPMSAPLIAEHKPTGNATILVAEDNPVNQLVLKGLLRKINFEADIANNGKEVLEMLSQNRYALLLLDIQMPVMDGLTAIAQIRAQDNLKKFPVIALTANTSPNDIAEYFKAGCDDYLAKPIQPDKLEAKIRAMITSDVNSPEERAPAAISDIPSVSLEPAFLEVVTSAVAELKLNTRIFDPSKVHEQIDALAELAEIPLIAPILEQLNYSANIFDDEVLASAIEQLEALL